MYNSLYENKMKDRFAKNDKAEAKNENSRLRKRSDGKFVIRVWNPEETFYSQNLRNWSFTVFFLFLHLISIHSFFIFHFLIVLLQLCTDPLNCEFKIIDLCFFLGAHNLFEDSIWNDLSWRKWEICCRRIVGVFEPLFDGRSFVSMAIWSDHRANDLCMVNPTEQVFLKNFRNFNTLWKNIIKVTIRHITLYF